MEYVILVDENDNEIGTMEKIQAHREAILHRAFSVFIFNSNGEMLLQQRALSKYHSPGLWTNACCSHPRPTETIMDAAKRRLNEELGFSCELKHQTQFIYKAKLDQGMTEHELDHVLFGNYEGEIIANPEEVSEFKFWKPEEIKKQVKDNPQQFTEWFKIIFNNINFSEYANIA